MSTANGDEGIMYQRTCLGCVHVHSLARKRTGTKNIRADSLFFVIPFYLQSGLEHSANCVKNVYM
jgi:hypothetical protein